MQVLLPRITLLLLSVAIAVFCYYESIYYADHAVSLGSKSAEVRSWMWVFRSIAGAFSILAIVLIVDLIRKLFL